MGLLRGYGNAIVPQVAAAFVSAGVKAGDTVIVEEAVFPESERFVGQEGEVVGVNSYNGEIYVDMGGKQWITASRVRLTARQALLA